MKNLRKQEKLLMLKAMEKWCKMFSKFTIVKSRSLWVVKRGHASHIALIYSKQLFSQIIPCEQEVAGHRFGLYYSFRRLIPILLIMIKVRNSCLWNVPTQLVSCLIEEVENCYKHWIKYQMQCHSAHITEPL